MLEWFPYPVVLTLLFVGLLFIELYATLWFAKKPLLLSHLRGLSGVEKISLGGRLLFWCVVFFIWVIFLGDISQTLPFLWIKFVGPRIDVNLILVYWGMGWMTRVAAVIAIFCYLLLTVFWRTSRLLTTMFIPGALSFFLFQFLYEKGGLASLVSEEQVLAQPGVKQIFHGGDIQRHPRDICFDQQRNAMFLSYGCTFCAIEEEVPSLIKVDLQSGESLKYYSGPIREFSCPKNADLIAVAPWHSEDVILIRRDDLQEHQRIHSHFQKYITLWEPMSLIYDPTLQKVFVTNDVEPAVISFSTTSGRLDKVLNLWTDGYISLYGTPAYSPRQPIAGKTIYFTSGPGDNLYAVDPHSLEIVKSVPLGDIAGTALLVSPSKELIWYQSSVNDQLFVIDQNDLTVKNTLKGERFSRGLLYDEKRDLLYLLDYFGGKFISMDPYTGKRYGAIDVGGRPNAMIMNNDKVFIHSMLGVLELDLSILHR